MRERRGANSQFAAVQERPLRPAPGPPALQPSANRRVAGRLPPVRHPSRCCSKQRNRGPWFALGEFVDNAVESCTQHREALEKIEGKGAVMHEAVGLGASPERLLE